MQSDRSTSWDRATRNTEVSMREAVTVDVLQAPVEVSPGKFEAKLKVTNRTGHRVPSGYPDGRRLWVHFNATDALGNSVFESGEYDYANASLADGRVTSNTITSAGKAMVYEKVTGADGDGDGSYTESPQLLNPVVIFDNRIPPKGFEADKYLEAGVKFITNSDTGGTGVVPTTDMDRFANNEDVITYRFDGPEGATLDVEAEMLYQTHSRPFMEMLKDNQPASSPRPEGPPSIYEPNYPLTPNYLSQNPALDFANAKDMDGNALEDNWGGIAYASWLKTGKGAPQKVDRAKSGVTVAPGAVGGLAASSVLGDPAFGDARDSVEDEAQLDQAGRRC